MASFERDGATLHYEQHGSGPAVILQHPLTADGRVWKMIGVSGALAAAGFCVIEPDALGHGRSSPAAINRVGLSPRVADILCLADHLSIERFHFAGYSMGGWIGTGLMRDARERLLSASIAGWDPIDGARRFTAINDMQERRDEFEGRILELTTSRPGGVRPDAERVEGYVETYERLFIDLPSITTMIGEDLPVMIAVGREDPYLNPARSAAEALGVEYLELPGNHVTAFQSHAYADGLIDWMQRQSSSRHQP